MAFIPPITELLGSSNIVYDSKLSRQIIEHRRTLENVLFIDRLLNALETDQTLYPPQSAEDSKSLLDQITQSISPDHHKLSVIYYVIKDLSQRKPDAAEYFVQRSYIPKNYRIFIDGIWHLDRLQFDKALDYLTEPSLIPTFPEEILYTLCRHSPDGDYDFAISYYNSVSSFIKSDEVLKPIFERLAGASVTEAFYFARSLGDPLDQQLFQHLLQSVMKLPSGGEKSMKGTELILLPLNAQEEALFSEYLGSGSGSKLPGAADSVMMRDVALSKYKKGSNRRKRSHRKIDGLDWTVLNNASASHEAFG